MTIYVPYGETETTERENAEIVEGLGRLGAETFRTPNLDEATSMVASATDLGEIAGSQATYLAMRLGRDVLLLCKTTRRRDELLAKLGEEKFSIMAATNEIMLQSALKTHIDSQELLANMQQRRHDAGDRESERAEQKRARHHGSSK